jgi:hypothetical protein
VGAALEGGTIRALVAGIRSGDTVQGGEGLVARGGRYRVRVQVDLRRRTAALALREEPVRGEPSAWREVLARGTMPDPLAGDGGRRVVLRSWESLRLVEARLRGSRQR